MPAISVIVPVYKVEEYLHRCVDSLLSQSFGDFDLILVDDGSPDGCGSICEEYAQQDARVHVIHRENGGRSAARNTGIDWAFAKSDSQWLTFVDSDDWVHRDFLKLLYEAAAETGCRLAACGNFRTGGEAFPEEAEAPCRVLSADDYYCGAADGRNAPVTAWAKLYDKSLFTTLRYPAGKIHEDEFTTYRTVYAAERVALVPRLLYAYYQNPAGIMQSKWTPKRLVILEAMEAQIAFARENGNRRLLEKVTEGYVFCIHHQLAGAGSWEGRDKGEILRTLRKKLRRGLKQGRKFSLFPLTWQYLWAYEEAYPVKPFWWLLNHGKQALDRMWGKRGTE